MRLIDMDELKKKLEVEHCDCELIQIIDDMPAIDAEPVKHGAWRRGENFGGEFRDCSVCNVRHYNVSFWKYCPYCGSKMDGDDNDKSGEVHNQTQ